MFFFFIKKFIVVIISIIIIVWYLLPFLINIKRWFLGISSFNIIYPIDTLVLKIYFYLYILLFIFLIYKIIKMYYVYNNKSNFLLTYIDMWLEKPWMYLENKLWRLLEINLDISKTIVEIMHSNNYLYYYYVLIIYMIYIPLFICIIVLYIEVLYIQSLYYIYYCLGLLLLYRVLTFVLNRFLTVLYNSREVIVSNFFILNLDKRLVCLNNICLNNGKPLEDYFLIGMKCNYFYFDRENKVVIFKYEDLEVKGKYIYDFYTLNFVPKEIKWINNLQEMFKDYCNIFNLPFKNMSELFKEGNEYYLYDFEVRVLGPITLGLREDDIYINKIIMYKSLINKHILFMSLIRVLSIIILISIVLFINI